MVSSTLVSQAISPTRTATVPPCPFIDEVAQVYPNLRSFALKEGLLAPAVRVVAWQRRLGASILTQRDARLGFAGGRPGFLRGRRDGERRRTDHEANNNNEEEMALHRSPLFWKAFNRQCGPTREHCSSCQWLQPDTRFLGREDRYRRVMQEFFHRAMNPGRSDFFGHSVWSVVGRQRDGAVERKSLTRREARWTARPWRSAAWGFKIGAEVALGPSVRTWTASPVRCARTTRQQSGVAAAPAYRTLQQRRVEYQPPRHGRIIALRAAVLRKSYARRIIISRILLLSLSIGSPHGHDTSYAGMPPSTGILVGGHPLDPLLAAVYSRFAKSADPLEARRKLR